MTALQIVEDALQALRRNLKQAGRINYHLLIEESPAGIRSFRISAPAPSIDAVRQAVQSAVWEQPAGALQLRESKSSPGHIGEGWGIEVVPSRQAMAGASLGIPRGSVDDFLSMEEAVYAGVAEGLRGGR